MILNCVTSLLLASHQARDIVGSMLGQRLRRWTNIEPTMAQCIVFTEMLHVGWDSLRASKKMGVFI